MTLHGEEAVRELDLEASLNLGAPMRPDARARETQTRPVRPDSSGDPIDGAEANTCCRLPRLR